VLDRGNADIVPGKSRELAVHAQVDSVVLNGWCKNDSDIPNGGRFTTRARATSGNTHTHTRATSGVSTEF